jgi:hypothetical protein
VVDAVFIVSASSADPKALRGVLVGYGKYLCREKGAIGADAMWSRIFSRHRGAAVLLA